MFCQATSQLLGDPLGVRTEPEDHREDLATELLGMSVVFFREIEIALFQRGGSLGGFRSSQDQAGTKIGDERIIRVDLLEPFPLFLGSVELSALEQRLGIEGDRGRVSTPGRRNTGQLARLVRLTGVSRRLVSTAPWQPGSSRPVFGHERWRISMACFM